MNTQITAKEREFRKTEKKIRHLKPDEGVWDMVKIGELEQKSNLLKEGISREREKKNEISVRKTKEEKWTDDDWMDSFRGESMDPDDHIDDHIDMIIDDHIDDHTIPNTRETRLLRKKIIKNIQTHMIDEEVVRQLQLKRIMDFINGLQKEQMEEEQMEEEQMEQA